MSPTLARIFRDGQAGLTDRSVQNRHYQLRAFQVLGMCDDVPLSSPYRWLVDGGQTGHPVYRKSILQALGRIDDDDTLRLVATYICEHRLRTRDAVAAIRHVRLGIPEPRPPQLVHELVSAVDQYRTRYPTTSWEDIRAAIAELEQTVSVAEEAEGN